MKKRHCVILVILTMTLLSWWAYRKTCYYINRMRTFDTMALVYFIAGKLPALDEASLLIEAVCKEYPELAKDGNVVDAWGNPLKINLVTDTGGIRLDIRSAGHDGSIGTSDDLTKIIFYPNQDQIKENAVDDKKADQGNISSESNLTGTSKN